MCMFILYVLIQWFKSQKVKKPNRVLPPLSPCSSVVNRPTMQSSVAEGLDKLKVALLAKFDEDIVRHL
jgi:poly [ADP-ribose] polymerase 1